jgi:flagellar biosynthesis chaperone FliJ
MKSLSFLLLTFTLVLGAKLDLTHIKSTAFGKQLLDTVALQLTTTGAIDKVLALLQELDDSLVQEQEEADAVHEEYQRQCNQTISQYEELLAVAKSDFNQAVSDISLYEPLIEQTKAEIEGLEKQLQDTIDTKDKATAQREQEREVYKQKMIDHDEAIDACDQATQLVLQLKTSGSSFLQQPMMLEIGTHVAAVRKIAPAYAALFKALIQMSTSTTADQEMVVRLINLIDKLKQSFLDSKDLETENEDAAEAAYVELIDQLNATITALEGEIGTKKNDLASYEYKVEEAYSLKADAEKRVDTFTTLLEQVREMCRLEQVKYDDDTAARQEERDIVAEVIELIETRLTDLSEYVTEKIDSVEA